jgi:hypothetical protein
MAASDLVDELQQLPERVRDVIADLTNAQLRWRPAPEEWSILEVCGHLRDAFEIEGLRLLALLRESHPRLPAFDGVAYARQRLCNYDDPERVIAALETHCAFIADTLAGLQPGDWERAGEHEEAGPVSVASRANGLPEHGRDHLAQIRALREQLGQR